MTAGNIKTALKRLPGYRYAAGWVRRQESRAARSDYRNPSGRARILITGDRGKLGTNLVAALKEDYDLVGYDIKANPRENLQELNQLKRRMDGCTYVIHTAGIPHPKKGPIQEYVRTNTLGSFNVMQAAAAVGVQRLVVFSTVGYYGCNIDGKLYPQYFPIDENHPLASVQGRSRGKLDEYNQSKVMMEELLAYYATSGAFEAISLRIAPANTKAQQYPENDPTWREQPRYRRSAFWTNCHPDYVTQAAKLALEAAGPFTYEAFNICDRYAPDAVDIAAFLEAEYPGAILRSQWNGTPQQSLISVEKAERLLGFRPCEDLR